MTHTPIHRSATPRRSAGFSMLEVMLAIAILSFALLALAALQTQLIKTSSDTKARGAATSLAQGQMDRFRSIEQQAGDNTILDYGDIVDGGLGDDSTFGGSATDYPGGKVTLSGTEFDMDWDVTGFVWDPDASTFVEQADGDTGTASYKRIAVTVAWVDEAGDTQEVVIEDIIPKTTPKESGRAIATDTGDVDPPIVGYEPQPAPEVVRVPTLGVGGDRFKETSKPLPDVLRNDFSTITTFSTVTFDAADGGAFETVRREDFFVVNCVCRYSNEASAGTGRSPTLWNGEEYVVGDEIPGKDVGIKVDGTVGSFRLTGQPVLCDACCRDHHDKLGETDPDTGEPYPLYDPFRPDDSGPAVDRNGDGIACTSTSACDPEDLDTNYSADNHHHFFAPTNPLVADTQLEIASTSSGLYYEACRFIRVDGLLRVAQDFHMRAFNQMPSTQLQTTSGLENYQQYVVDFVEEYISEVRTLSDYPQVLPDTDNFTASFTADSVFESDLPVQFLSRGIYVDFMSDELLDCINTRGFGGAVGDDTPAYCTPQAGDVLDIIPFYEVNVTLLANWSFEGNVEVTNEPIADGSELTYSRGRATFDNEGAAATIVASAMENSNSGLTDSRKIDSDETTREVPTDDTTDFINTFYDQIDLATAGAQQRIIVRGTIQLANQVTSVTPSDIFIEGRGEAACTKPTDDTYRCIIDPADDYIADPTVLMTLLAGMTVSNYGDEFQQGNNLVFEDNNVCATGINFNRGTSGEGSQGESVSYQFLLNDPALTFVAGDETVFSLNLRVVPQNRACTQAAVGPIPMAF